MKVTTATSLRKELFSALERAIRSVPTRIRYKRGEAVLLPYSQYEALKGMKKPAVGRKGLRPLVYGKICKPLNREAEDELIRYMGL